MSRRGQNCRGFTLLEIMAVIALISVVFLVALEFYTNLSRASAHAANKTRELRRVTAILDRVARDFEATTLLRKPSEMDPLEHPWLFVAESRTESDGADHILFITRNHDPTRTEAPETNLTMVAYMAKKNDQDLISLYRWSSPHLPESLEKDFPDIEDEKTFLVADDLSTFGVILSGEDSGGGDEWDSTTMLQSGKIPNTIQIQLALARDRTKVQRDEFGDVVSSSTAYERKVWLPMRPLQRAMLTDPLYEGNVGSEPGEEEDPTGTGGSKDEGGERGERECSTGPTAGECVDCNQRVNVDLDANYLAGLRLGCRTMLQRHSCFDRARHTSAWSVLVRPSCL
jgi:prepilin-type N-terminal cleavage/methylation domain-containing protein